jgi:hypothetical protein
MLQPLEPYPENCLTPKFANAIFRLQRYAKVPLSMAASSAIAAVALACQGGYVVERKPGLVFPIGLAMLTLATRSERKSSTDRLFTRPIREFEKRLEITYEERLQEWRNSQAIQTAKKTGLQRAITKAISRGEDTTAFEVQLRSLAAGTTEKPKLRRLIMDLTSVDGILDFLHDHGGSCGLMIDEGASFFESRAAKYAGTLAKLWSGDDTRRDNKALGSFTISSPRFTISIQVQPEILEDFLLDKGKYWRDTGLLSRFLPNFPMSNIGYHMEDLYFPETLDLGDYDARMLEILSSAPCCGTTENVVLKFDPAALYALADFSNFIQTHIRPQKWFSDVSDAASKIAENAARMAAVFHVFEGYDGPISGDTVHRAVLICQWHLHNFKYIFGDLPEATSLEQDAIQVERCIIDFHQKVGLQYLCPKNRIAQYATKALKNNIRRREAAIDYLIQSGRAQVQKCPNSTTTYLKLLYPPFNGVGQTYTPVNMIGGTY